MVRKNKQTSPDKINKEKRILYVRALDSLEKRKEGQIGFICSLLDKDEELHVELAFGHVVFAIEINPNNEIYNTIKFKKSLDQCLGWSEVEETFYLAPEDFKIVSIFIESNMSFGAPLVILNQNAGANSNSQCIPLCEQNWRSRLVNYVECDISMAPFLSQDITELTKFFNDQELQSIRNFFIVYSNHESARYFSLEQKIELLQLVDLPQCQYLLAMLYDDLNSEYYDPDKAFDYLQNCGEYLPAQKAILPKYIAASFDENGKIENPQAYALAEQTANGIIALEPDNKEAQMFLNRGNTYESSIRIAEDFQTIVGQPMTSMTFFKSLTKKMHLVALFNAKSQGDANDQHEFDKHYGLVVKPPQP